MSNGFLFIPAFIENGQPMSRQSSQVCLHIVESDYYYFRKSQSHLRLCQHNLDEVTFVEGDVLSIVGTFEEEL